jgi:hypothetical protein
MYGYEEIEAPRWFSINPLNHSGKRLYWLTGLKPGELWVTNCHSMMGTHSGFHGKPEHKWLRENLLALPRSMDDTLLLICGRVAQKTFEGIGLNFDSWEHKIRYFKHPAARTWTRKELDKTQKRIKEILCSY